MFVVHCRAHTLVTKTYSLYVKNYLAIDSFLILIHPHPDPLMNVYRTLKSAMQRPLLYFLFTSKELRVLVNRTATMGLVMTVSPPSITAQERLNGDTHTQGVSNNS